MQIVFEWLQADLHFFVLNENFLYFKKKLHLEKFKERRLIRQPQNFIAMIALKRV